MAEEIKDEGSCCFPHCDERAVREEYCPVCWEMIKESQEEFDKKKQNGKKDS